jgi:hypothetical protein
VLVALPAIGHEAVAQLPSATHRLPAGGVIAGGEVEQVLHDLQPIVGGAAEEMREISHNTSSRRDQFGAQPRQRRILEAFRERSRGPAAPGTNPNSVRRSRRGSRSGTSPS